MSENNIPDAARWRDDAALRAAADGAAALCTVTRIDGSFSRRTGAQLAIRADGGFAGDLADGCLEAALAEDAARLRGSGSPRAVLRYGAGSPNIDFRLPCGGGLDVLVDAAPDRALCADTVRALDQRCAVALSWPRDGGPMGRGDASRPSGVDGDRFNRRYAPPLRLLLLGAGPEMDAAEQLGVSMGLIVETRTPLGNDGGTLVLGRPPTDIAVDAWTAVLLLFHDHEWERSLIPWALESDACFIGAQGGAQAREGRMAMLGELGFDDCASVRVHSPVGLIGRARDPMVLALSALSEIVAHYEALAHGA
ncbi:XdhC family protein [Novosphingopyxis sp.]|uniref:XdhC family protein n=1 Tax=Novosphingopyxis sp. TaxID=2709690 RepID=UPI003B5B9E1C